MQCAFPENLSRFIFRSPSRVLMSLLLILSGPLSVAEPFVAGTHYSVIESPVAPISNYEDGTVEVVELFWYGCPHCYSFESYVNPWLETKPDNVEFVRIPAVFSKQWAFHAQAFYTAEELGVLDKIHPALFHAIHDKRRRMSKVDEIAELFANEANIDEATFLKTFNGFSVDSKVRRAAKLTRDYGLTGVPCLVVDGASRITGKQAGGYDKMLKIVDQLADK